MDKTSSTVVTTTLLQRGQGHWNALLHCNACGPLSVATSEHKLTAKDAREWALNLRHHHIGTCHTEESK